MMRKYILFSLGLLLCTACGPSPESHITPTASVVTTTGGVLPATSTRTPTPTVTSTPTPSPTLIGGFPGQFIHVVVSENQAEIVLYNADGSVVKTLWTSPPDLSVPYIRARWSPTGDAISVEYLREGTHGYLLLLRPDGTEITTINTGITFFGGPNGQANWSPDGRWIAFASMGAHTGVDIYRLDADGQNMIQLTNTYVRESGPIFSPDGRIVYRDDNDNLFIMQGDGTGQELLMWGPAAIFGWSHDGRHALLERASPADLFVMDINTKELTRHTYNGSGMFESGVGFSPDGEWILYRGYSISGTGNRIPSVGEDLFVVPVDQSVEPHLLATVFQAALTPDGTLVVFHGWPAGTGSSQSGYYAVRPDGTGLVRLPEEAFGLVYGQWQPGSAPQYPRGTIPFVITTPVPAWSPLPTPPIYDDFSGPTLNSQLWSPSSWIYPDEGQPVQWSFSQNESVLLLSSDSSTATRGMNMNLVQPSSRNVLQVAAFEARLSLRSISRIAAATVDAHLRVDAVLSSDYLWWTECVVSASGGAGPTFACSVWRFSEGYPRREYGSRSIPVELDHWYAVRIEFEPTSGAIQFYLDSELLDTYTPADAARLREAAFTPMVGINAYGEGTVTAWVDDVRISEGPGPVWACNQPGSVYGWRAWNDMEMAIDDGLIVVDSRGQDPHMGSEDWLDLDAATSTIVHVRMRVPGAAQTGQLFFITADDGIYDEAKSVRFALHQDGELHTYSLNMRSVTGWRGIIRQLRLDPFERRGTAEIECIWVSTDD